MWKSSTRIHHEHVVVVVVVVVVDGGIPRELADVFTPTGTFAGVAGKPGTPLKSLKSPKKGKKGKSSESPVPIVPKLKPAPKPPKLTPAQERAALDKTNSAALTAMAASFGTRKLSTTETAMNLSTKNHGQEYVNRPGDRLKVKMHLKKPEEAEMFLTLEKDEADLYIAGILDM